MKFSIIIPTYNRGKFIVEAIDSVLAQSYPHYEIIVVDDGSTDDTGSIVQSRYGAHEAIRYFYKENEERAVARNFGWQKATGDYAVFFDSDDWMERDYLQILHEAIAAQDRPPAMVAAKYSFRDETGKEWPSSMAGLREGWYGVDLFLKGNLLACNFCVRLAEPGLRLFPPERRLASMEDWLFLLQNLVEKRIYILGGLGVVMREHQGRSMANNQKIIKARKEATAWALKHIRMTPAQQKALTTYSAYFYGIHEFLDGNRKGAVKESIEAIRSGGVRPSFLLLLVKSVIGKKTIDRIKVYAN